MADRRPLGYLDGLGAAIAAIALIVLGAIALQTGRRQMYEDMQVPLPLLTRVVMHPAFALGAPLVILALLIAAHVRRGHAYAMLGVATIAVALAVITFVGLYQPIWALAGSIQ